MRSLFIENIPQEGLELREKHLPSFLGLEDDEFISYIDPISVSLNIEKIRDSVRVKGRGKFKVRLICARCLEPFLQEIRFPLDAVYKPESSRVIKREEFLDEGDTNIFFYGENGIIELRDPIREYVILYIPVKPLCKSDCQGMCPSCGKNLNKGKCSCRLESLDPRFAKLKDFKERK